MLLAFKSSSLTYIKLRQGLQTGAWLPKFAHNRGLFAARLKKRGLRILNDPSFGWHLGAQYSSKSSQIRASEITPANVRSGSDGIALNSAAIRTSAHGGSRLVGRPQAGQEQPFACQRAGGRPNLIVDFALAYGLRAAKRCLNQSSSSCFS